MALRAAVTGLLRPAAVPLCEGYSCLVPMVSAGFAEDIYLAFRFGACKATQELETPCPFTLGETLREAGKKLSGSTFFSVDEIGLVLPKLRPELSALSTLDDCWTGSVERGKLYYPLGLSTGIAGAFLLSEAASDEPKDSEVADGSEVSNESNGSGPKKSLFDRLKEKFDAWKQKRSRDLEKERSDLEKERALFEKQKSDFEKQRAVARNEWREIQMEKAHMWQWGKDYYEKKLEHEKFMDEDNKFHERVMADKNFERLQLEYKIAKIPKVPSAAVIEEGPYSKALRGSLFALKFPGNIVTNMESFERSSAFWVVILGAASFSYFTVGNVKAFVDGRVAAIERHVNRILGRTPGPGLCYCGKPYPELCSFCGELLPEFDFVICDLYATHPSIVDELDNDEATASPSKASSGGKA